MSTTPQPQIDPRKQTIVQSVALGLQLLPFFVQSIETLFGRKTGQTKKAAVTQLFNASVLGAAAGFGLAGDPSNQLLLQTLQPLGSAAIDTIAGTLYPPGTTVAPAPPNPVFANAG